MEGQVAAFPALGEHKLPAEPVEASMAADAVVTHNPEIRGHLGKEDMPPLPAASQEPDAAEEIFLPEEEEEGIMAGVPEVHIPQAEEEVPSLILPAPGFHIHRDFKPEAVKSY